MRLRFLLGRFQLAKRHRERRLHGRRLAGPLRLVGLVLVRRGLRNVLQADEHGFCALLKLWYGRRQWEEHHGHGDEFVSV